MLTIHPLRTNHHVILPEEEFTLLLRKILETQPVEVIERHPDDIETEEDQRSYLLALQELEHGDTVDFEELQSAWLSGKAAHV